MFQRHSNKPVCPPFTYFTTTQYSLFFVFETTQLLKLKGRRRITQPPVSQPIIPAAQHFAAPDAFQISVPNTWFPRANKSNSCITDNSVLGCYCASELHTNAGRISNNSSRGADIRLNMSCSVFPSFHFVSLAFRLALVAVSLFANCAITGVITFRLVTAVGINPPSITRSKYSHTIRYIYFPAENSSCLFWRLYWIEQFDPERELSTGDHFVLEFLTLQSKYKIKP